MPSDQELVSLRLLDATTKHVGMGVGVGGCSIKIHFTASFA